MGGAMLDIGQRLVDYCDSSVAGQGEQRLFVEALAPIVTFG
jgi:hypothetical protein